MALLSGLLLVVAGLVACGGSGNQSSLQSGAVTPSPTGGVVSDPILRIGEFYIAESQWRLVVDRTDVCEFVKDDPSFSVSYGPAGPHGGQWLPGLMTTAADDYIVISSPVTENGKVTEPGALFRVVNHDIDHTSRVTPTGSLDPRSSWTPEDDQKAKEVAIDECVKIGRMSDSG